MRVLILGRADPLFESARLLSEKHSIVGVITAPASSEYKRKEVDFEALAKSLGCPYRCIRRVGPEEIAFIRSLTPEIAVSANWVSTLREDVLGLYPRGCLNAHYADLPKYRGNAATNWAILKHENQIPLMIHYMVAGELDAGDIVAQKPMPLTEETTIADVTAFCESEVPKLFRCALDDIETGVETRVRQADRMLSPMRCYPRLPVHSKIDWSASARDLHALVRASTRPYSGAYTYQKAGGQIRKLFVWRSRIVLASTEDLGVPGHIVRNDARTGESWVYTGSGILALQEVQYDSEEAFQPGCTWTSIRSRFNIDVEAELIELQNRLSRLGE